MLMHKILSPYHLLANFYSSKLCIIIPEINVNSLKCLQGCSLYHFYDGLWYDPAGCTPMTYCMRGRLFISPTINY